MLICPNLKNELRDMWSKKWKQDFNGGLARSVAWE
jgi:hypothetical protein